MNKNTKLNETLFYKFFKETYQKLINNSKFSEENRLLINNIILDKDSYIIESSNNFANKLKYKRIPDSKKKTNNE